MRPTFLSHLPPLSAVATAVPRVDSAVRIWMDPVLRRCDTVDGVWWPYSRDAGAELPGLIAAVDQRLGRTTVHVSLHLDVWQHVPHWVPARGRRVSVGCSHSDDPCLIMLMFTDIGPVTLQIMPPDLAAGDTLTVRPPLAGRGPIGVLDATDGLTEPDVGVPHEDGAVDRQTGAGDITDQPQPTPV